MTAEKIEVNNLQNNKKDEKILKEEDVLQNKKCNKLKISDFLNLTPNDIISFDQLYFKYKNKEGEEASLEFLLDNHYTERCSLKSLKQIFCYDHGNFIVVSADYDIRHRWATSSYDDFNGYGYLVLDKRDGKALVSFVNNTYYQPQYDDEDDEYDVLWHKNLG